MRTQLELLVGTTVDFMIHRLMVEYQATYQWAMNAILCSDTYKRLIKIVSFRNESPLYVYQFLKEEFIEKNIIPNDEPSSLVMARPHHYNDEASSIVTTTPHQSA